MADWGPIESDPVLFSQLIWDLGVKKVQMEELWDLSDESLAALPQPVYGLIFLFKWEAASGEDAATPKGSDPQDHPDVFFAQQVIQNACATQAILSILFNQASNLTLGPALQEFYTDVSSFPADMRGLAMSNSEHIRSIHNRFSKNDPFVNDGLFPENPEDGEEPFHFVSYAPVNGALYELDGLVHGPISHGPCTDADWLGKAREVIQARMQTFPLAEIRFNLMALTKSRLASLEEKHADISAQAQQLAQEGRTAEAESLQGQLVVLSSEIEEESLTEPKYRALNARRTHNYLELIQALLAKLATKGDMDGAIAKAQVAGKKRQDRRRLERLTKNH